MANYKHYMGNGFRACRLVALGYDPHRNRDVRMFKIPGEPEVLGVTDGVDTWIAPLTSPFLEPVAKAIRSEVAGDAASFPIILGRRPDASPRAPRRALLTEDPPPAPKVARRALLVDSDAPQPPVRRRVTLTE